MRELDPGKSAQICSNSLEMSGGQFKHKSCCLISCALSPKQILVMFMKLILGNGRKTLIPVDLCWIHLQTGTESRTLASFSLLSKSWTWVWCLSRAASRKLQKYQEWIFSVHVLSLMLQTSPDNWSKSGGKYLAFSLLRCSLTCMTKRRKIQGKSKQMFKTHVYSILCTSHPNALICND